MTCPTGLDFAYGTKSENSQLQGLIPARASWVDSRGPNPLERLAQLVIANDRLMDELAVSRSRIFAAREYLDRVGSNAMFGQAHLARCRSKHSGILAQLRANRIEALILLGDSREEA